MSGDDLLNALLRRSLLRSGRPLSPLTSLLACGRPHRQLDRLRPRHSRPGRKLGTRRSAPHPERPYYDATDGTRLQHPHRSPELRRSNPYQAPAMLDNRLTNARALHPLHSHPQRPTLPQPSAMNDPMQIGAACAPQYGSPFPIGSTP